MSTTESASYQLQCHAYISGKHDDCTVSFDPTLDQTLPKCLVVEDFETEEAFYARKPDRFEQGCVGGSTMDSSAFYCNGKSQRLTSYQGVKYVEFTYCCDTDFCNRNTSLILPDKFPLSSSPVTADPSIRSEWVNNTVQLIIPSIIVPLVCIGVIVSLVFGFCVSYRGKNKRRKGVKTRHHQHAFFDSRTRVSGTIDTDVYNLSTVTYGGSTVSSANGIPLLEQRTISRHITLEQMLGQGRYGTVYQGDWRGYKVAVKIFFSHNEDSWKHEADIFKTCMLRHNNILGFIAADLKDDNESIQLWLVTDFHQKGSLTEHLNRNQLEHLEALKLCTSLATGLAFLHDDVRAKDAYKPAMAHRDLKSRNVLVKSDGECCIGDLGMAIREGYMGDFKMADPTQGTRRYMSPEGLTGCVDLRQIESLKQSDVYSMGLVIWEIALRWRTCSKEWCEKAQLPYEDTFPIDPSLCEMYRLVIKEEERPFIPDRWTRNNTLSKLITMLQECWYRDPMARLTAYKVKNILSSFE